jgi:excisionase family DNA binding protein
VTINEQTTLDHKDDLRLMTVVEAADYLAMSRGSVYNLMRSGAITSVHIGRARRIPFAELQRFVRAALAAV